MAIFELRNDCLVELEETRFGDVGVRERTDLQRLLREQLALVAPDNYVIAEEFGEWEESRRRIDLLALDKDANIVVVELKRSEDGGHMELQAIRYAAMVSAMTFEQVVEAHERFLEKMNREDDAQASILEFLGWDGPDEDQFAQQVRIVLISADFGLELTTAVMWLNEQGLDIRCVRLKPYKLEGRLLVDAQQLIPLPEMADFVVKIREKKRRETIARNQGRDLTRYDVTVGDETYEKLPKRWTIYRIVKYLCESGVNPEEITAIVGRNGMFYKVEGVVDSETFVSGMLDEREAGGRQKTPHRFFKAKDELIHSGGNTYALTNQWGRSTTGALDKLIQAYPDKDVSYSVADAGV